MKHIVALSILGLSILVIASPASGLVTWMTITDASLVQLDSDSYRLLVQVDWGVTQVDGGAMDVTFDHFRLDLLGDTRYNPTNSAWYGEDNSGVDWYRDPQISSNLDPVFGYDFDIAGGLGHETVTMNYYASWNWWEFNRVEGRVPAGDYALSGSFQIIPATSTDEVAATPEPNSFVLMALGLLISALVVRNRHRFVRA